MRQKEFVHVLHLTELSSSSLLNHIASPENLPCEYCVAAPVKLLISNVHNDPIMIQQLLLTSFFTNNEPNTKKFNPFLVEMATCEFTIAA